MNSTKNRNDSQECVGLIVATHSKLAGELIKTAELIVGPMDGVYALEIEPEADTSELMKLFEEKVNIANKGAGVIIMTDIFGGTPTNIALSLSNHDVDVVSGVNLPMLIKAYSLRCEKPLGKLARIICEYARRHIKNANDILGPES